MHTDFFNMPFLGLSFTYVARKLTAGLTRYLTSSFGILESYLFFEWSDMALVR